MRRFAPHTVALLALLTLVALRGEPSGAAVTGLVAAYGFNEGSGTTVADASGNGNNGTVANTSWSATGKFGGALSFNGTNARVNVPNAASLQLGSGMTLEAWVDPTAISRTWRDVVYKGNDNYYLMATTDHAKNVPAGGGTFGGVNRNAFGSAALVVNTWAHLATTYDGTAVRTYVNGTLVGSQAASGAIASSSNQLQIGGDSIFGQYFKGLIDEVRVYNVALSQTAIQSDMNTAVSGGGGTTDTTPPSAPGTTTATAVGAAEVDLTWGAASDNVGVAGYRIERCQGVGCTTFAEIGTSVGGSYQDLGLAASTAFNYRVRATDAAGNLGPYSNVATATTGSGGGSGGLVAAYSFDEGSGTTVGDSSGNGNTGTTANATWTATGKYGGALSLNGTNAQVTVPNSTSLQLSSGMTLEAWVNPTATTNSWRDVVYKGNDNYYLMAASDHSSLPVAGGTFGGANVNAFGAAVLPANTWSFLAATYDGAAVRYYLNGTLVTSQAASGAIASSSNALTIGGDAIYGQYFGGLVDQVRVYNGARTAGDIQVDMATPVGGGTADTSPPSTPSGLSAGTPGPTSIPLSWNASTDNVGVTGYRTYLNGTQVGTPLTTSYLFGGLSCGTTYTLGVAAVDAANNVSAIASVTQSTAACSDTTPPSTPAGLTVGAVGQTSVALSWTASTDNVGVTGYRTYVNGAQAGTSGTTSYSFTGLTCGSSYTLGVAAVDAANNVSQIATVAQATAACSDTSPPSTPSGLSAGTPGPTSIPLSWNASTDNVGVTGYRTYLNGTQVGTPLTTSYLFGGLSCGTTYTLGVAAVDAANNVSAIASISKATAACADTTPPSAPGTLSAAAVGSVEVDLTWGAATDNVGVTGYRIERCLGSGCSGFAQVGTSTGTSYQDTGLQAGAAYTYRVRAVDGAGNTGVYSNSATATTGNTPSGLVAAYSFDEGAGTTVADASGNGNGGALANATWAPAGKFGGALSFNGTTARVAIPNSASLQLRTGMTLEAWVNPTNTSNTWRDVVYKGNDDYYLMAGSDRSNGPAGGGTFGGVNGNAFGPTVLPAGAWSFIATTYDGATLRLYVNGTLVASSAVTGLVATSTGQLQIGGDSIYGQYFSGLIDQVRVYNSPLAVSDIQADMTAPIGTTSSTDTTPPSAPGTLAASVQGAGEIDLSWGAATDDVGVAGYRIDRCQGATCTDFSHLAQTSGSGTVYVDTTSLASGTTYRYQVRAVDAAGNLGPYSNVAAATTPVPPAGLVAAYSFDEGTGNVLGDSSGNGNNGTIANAVWAPQGKFGSALSFNGNNSRVDVPNTASLQLSSGMTLEAWVNPTGTPSSWRDLVYKGDDNYYLMAASDHGSSPAGGGTFNGANGNAFGAAALPANVWTFLAASYDGSTIRLYVNGALVGSQAATGAIRTSTSPLQIGGDSIYGQYFTGLIDEVRIYRSALSAAAIQADMSTAVAGAVPSIPGNLAATVKSSTEIDLTWSASSDRAGVVGYQVQRCQGDGCTNFAQIAAPSGTTYNDTNVSPGTTYVYRVRGVDSVGQVGPYSDTATGFTGLQLSPRQVALTPGLTQQYTASLAAGGSVAVTWSVDGIAGGTAASGTITSGGLYTAGTSVGAHTITATTLDLTQSGSAPAYVSALAGMYTLHDDNLRTGANNAETVLSPANVNATGFGKLFSRPLDGIAYASPLYVANVSIPGQGTHNVVFVATEHDSVYAFDADGRTSTPLWKVSFIDSARGITTVPAADTGECCDIEPEIGITGTPVIDPSTNTMYVVVATKEVAGGTTSYPIRLHALDLSTGAEKLGGPVDIQATVPGTGQGSSGGKLSFLGLRENQHTGLLLKNGVVYFSFASHGDFQPYHGWIFGYDATTLQQRLAFCLTPNGEGAGVWMGAGGLASDASGDIFFISGDGSYDGVTAWATSYLRLTPTGTVRDFFTPYNQSSLDAANHDLGSGGALLLPDQAGTHPHEMVSAGKDGTIYLVDRDNMGHFNSSTNNIVQTLANIFQPTGSSGSEPGNFSSPVYLGGYVYFAPNGDNVQGFRLTNGLLSTTPLLRSGAIYPDRGAALAASSNGASNGILWVTQRNGTSSPGVLYAFDPAGSTNGTLKELWDSNQSGTRDQFGVTAKFTSPLIANGKVFLANETQLTVFGLLP